MTTNKEVLKDFWEKLEDSPVVMLGLPRHGEHSEPMVAFFDDEFPNTLYFYTRKDNRLVEGLVPGGPHAMAQYVSKGHDLFACLQGRLSLCNEPRMVDYFWSDDVAAWFDGGKQDPMLQLLRFNLEHAEMWETGMSPGGMLKQMFGGSFEPEELREKHLTASF